MKELGELSMEFGWDILAGWWVWEVLCDDIELPQPVEEDSTLAYQYFLCVLVGYVVGCLCFLLLQPVDLLLLSQDVELVLADLCGCCGFEFQQLLVAFMKETIKRRQLQTKRMRTHACMHTHTYT
jgi:hypothetical protein